MNIKNERQDQITKLWIDKFQSAIKRIKPEDFSPEVLSILKAGMNSQIDDLKKEVEEYEFILKQKTMSQ